MEENSMQEILKKAEVLIEALPYIQRFNRKIIVVKYGGSAMVDEELKQSVIQDVTLLKLVGFKPIIVHGGGKEISKWVAKAGMEPEFINGLRKTDAPTMEIAEMVLGKVNKSLVQMVEKLGVNAVGISGKDGGLLKVNKKLSNGQDIGYVGCHAICLHIFIYFTEQIIDLCSTSCTGSTALCIHNQCIGINQSLFHQRICG